MINVVEKVRIPKYCLREIKNIIIPVTSLEIFCQLDLEDVKNIEFSEVASKTIKSIFIDSIKYESSPDFPQIISILKQKLFNLQEIKVGSYDSSQIKNELFDVLFDKKLGVKLPNICSKCHYTVPIQVTKNNILVYYKDNGVVRIMKAKSGDMSMQISQNNIEFSDEDFIVLKNFDLLTLEDINLVPRPKFEKKMFEDFLNKCPELKRRKRLVIIQNQNFDFVDLNLGYSKYMQHVNLAGVRKMNIYLPMIRDCANSEVSQPILEIVKSIPEDCEVSLKIDMNYQIDESLLDLVGILLNLKIQDIYLNVDENIVTQIDENLKDQVVDHIMALEQLLSFKFHKGSEEYHLKISKLDDQHVDKLQHACNHLFNNDNDSTFESNFIDDIEIL
jgi:hypothetical protein